MTHPLEAWKINREGFINLTDYTQRVKFLLRYAILAPSTHNCQPWLFKILENNSCELYLDKKIKLKEADPNEKCAYISMGCCLENLVVAAKAFGVYKGDLHKINQKTGLVAEVSFRDPKDAAQADKESGELVEAMVARKNSRGFFKPNKISKKLIGSIQTKIDDKDLEVTFIDDKSKIEKLAKITAEGIKRIYKRKSFRRELASWIHGNLSSKYDGMPGRSLHIPTPLSLIFPTVLKFVNVSPGIAVANYKSFSSAPLVCVLGTKSENVDGWLKMGRNIERLMLEFNRAGVQTSIFLASVDEESLCEEVKKEISAKYKPQFVFCAGYMERDQKHTPRHPLENKLC